MRYLFLPLLPLLLASPALAVRDLSSIPDGMRGTWDVSLQSCRLPSNDGRVTVAMRKVTFGVSLYEADHIAPVGSDGVRIDAVVREEGESEPMRGSIELKLIDASRLSIKTDLIDDTYVNCKDAS